MRLTTTLTLLLFIQAVPSSSDVVHSAGNGFSIRISLTLSDKPGAVYKVFLNEVKNWWSPSHTVRGRAENLSIEAKPHGWFLEKLPDGGVCRHLEVIQVQPGRMIRMSGGLGPLQELAVQGILTIEFKPDEKGTKLELAYNVGGYDRDGLERWAKPVDNVLSSQLVGLRRYLKLKQATKLD